MFVMPEVCVGGGALLFDLDSTVVSATSLSQQCIVYFPEGAADPPWVPGIASTPASPPPTAPPSRRCWSLSYLGARFDVFSRRRTGCSASLLRKGNAAHEERRDRAKRQPQRSTNGHEVFLPFYAPFTNVEAGHWLRLDPDNPFH